MLSRETLEDYRRMTTSQRFKLVLEMIRGNTSALLSGSPDLVDRRFELLRRENDERNRGILAGFARTRNDS